MRGGRTAVSQQAIIHGREPRWRRYDARLRRRLPVALASWLLDTESLTSRLQDICRHEFDVCLLGQHTQRPLFSERLVLGMRDHEFALVRQVHLACGSTPVVFARTVIPVATMRGALRRFAHLGNRPLGAMLFADRSMRRAGIEVARITPDHAVYPVVTGGRQEASPGAIWGRRSVFLIDGRPLLVNEIFLPALLRRKEPRRAVP